MSIQVMNDTSSVVTLKISQNFDIIINEVASKINRGRAIYVGVRELPFWILRFIALKKKENPQREAMILWKKINRHLILNVKLMITSACIFLMLMRFILNLIKKARKK